MDDFLKINTVVSSLEPKLSIKFDLHFCNLYIYFVLQIRQWGCTEISNVTLWQLGIQFYIPLKKFYCLKFLKFFRCHVFAFFNSKNTDKWTWEWHFAMYITWKLIILWIILKHVTDSFTILVTECWHTYLVLKSKYIMY